MYAILKCSRTQAGQKVGSMLRPFRQPDHLYKRSDLVRDTRAPGVNPKRDAAVAVREVSKPAAERSTQGCALTIYIFVFIFVHI